MKPVVIDLCCGLGGWSKGFLAEGWDAIGFDTEKHEYGDKRYPGHLILKSILEINGYDLRAVSPALVVASPPCQEYSYMAMPWKRGKQIAAALCDPDIPFPDGYTGSRTVEELTALYRACFRIARQAGCPIVLENVKGAQPWIGRAQAHYGSYYLWGNVESVGGAIVRSRGVPKFGETLRVRKGSKNEGGSWFAVAHNTESGHSRNPVTGEGLKVPGVQFSGYGEPGYKAQGFNVTAAQRYREERDGVKCPGNDTFKTDGVPVGKMTDLRFKRDGVKQRGSGPEWFDKALDERRKEATATKGAGGTWFEGNQVMPMRQHNSKSDSRKAASAMIAEIPFDLASYVARAFKPAWL